MRDGSNLQDRWSPVYAVYMVRIYARGSNEERMETGDAV